MEFFRFPHTPHLAWLGDGSPRDDKILPPAAREALLDSELVIEEKLDGANLGFSVSADGDLLVQNRGSYLNAEFCHEQFGPLWRWLDTRGSSLVDALWPDLMLFGEWCFALHSVAYDQLPDWFLGFDVYDRSEARFWNADRRDSLLAELRLSPVPRLATGRFTLDELEQLLDGSRVGNCPMEGVVVRREDGEWTAERAKLVRATFIQSIDTHWSRGPLRRNALQHNVEQWP